MPGDRLDVLKTYKLYINGAFPRSESGRSVEVIGASGKVQAHVAHASRKDLRDAVEAAAAAQPRWSAASEYNRGQVLYRMTEMLEGKKSEFVDLLKQASSGKGTKAQRHEGTKSTSPNPQDEVDASIDRLICFAGWADKYAQVLGCNNPVSGPYYNFTVPEPTGVVGIVTPPDGQGPALLGLISMLAPPLCAGNAVVAICDGQSMIPAAVFGEV